MPSNAYLGPYDYSYIETFFTACLAPRADRDALIAHADDALKTRRQTAQAMRMVAAFRDGKPELSYNDMLLSNRDRVRLDTGKPGPDGSIDFLAYYLPKCRTLKEMGIYFKLENILHLLEKNKALNPALLLKAVAVHELFHYYVDHHLNDDDAYRAHACSPWCDLEEAAANFVAHEQVKTHPDAARILAALFKPYPSGGGLHGYGEYCQLDERIVTEIIAIKFKKPECLKPSDFKKAMVLRLDPPDQRGILFWEGILAHLNEGRIPFYVDLG